MRVGNQGLLCVAAVLATAVRAFAADKPNIVYILCDDLGYGDVRCLNPQGKIATPHMDKLAAEGMAFTDAHSGSAVCTPTRYGILTGRYSWRTHLQSGVLHGGSPPLIAKDRLTVAGLLKEQGYATACIGKWHLGLGWAAEGGAKARGKKVGAVDYARPLDDGPTTHGFEYFFGIAASLDMPPYTYIHNDRVTELPTAVKAFHRKGPAAPSFEAVDVLPTLTKKAVEYIGQRAADKKPFFLYLPLNSPHTPIVPTQEWQGKSGLNPYGDFVMQTDASVGEVLAALDKGGLADNTLVILTSDNGCSPAAGIGELEGKGHYPSYHFRGHKADIFDGGHRIPLLVRWPGKIKAGTTCDQLTCLTDLMATVAQIVGAKLPDTAAEDSVSMLPALLGTADKPLREAVVHHSINGSFAIRQGRWKLELCADSGGWSAPKPGSAAAKQLPPMQLYDMTADVGERGNVCDKHPEVVASLTKLLEQYVADGRSTPGSPQKNDRAINIRKGKPLSTDESGTPITHD